MVVKSPADLDSHSGFASPPWAGCLTLPSSPPALESGALMLLYGGAVARMDLENAEQGPWYQGEPLARRAASPRWTLGKHPVGRDIIWLVNVGRNFLKEPLMLGS